MATAIATLVLNDGDAVGNDVLGMAKALRARGETVRLFAEKSRLNEEVYPLRELRGTSDTLIIITRCSATSRCQSWKVRVVGRS